MNGLNLTADDAINELERTSAAAERSRIVALLRSAETIEALALGFVPGNNRDEVTTAARAICTALAELIEKSDA